MSRAPDFNVGAWVDECFCVDCGTQHGKVKRCVRFCDVVGYVLCSVLGLFICLWFLFWLSLVAFLMFPVGIAWKVKWRVKLQVFATLILGARGRSNIFQHQKASARCLAVSILFQGGPGNGPTKRIQNRFRLEGAPAVAMSWFLQLEERVLKEHWWLLKPRPSGQFYTKGGPKNGSARRPRF